MKILNFYRGRKKKKRGKDDEWYWFEFAPSAETRKKQRVEYSF